VFGSAKRSFNIILGGQICGCLLYGTAAVEFVPPTVKAKKRNLCGNVGHTKPITEIHRTDKDGVVFPNRLGLT